MDNALVSPDYQFSERLRRRFASLRDPRVVRCRRYPLADIVLVVFCGLLCGADNLVAICHWADARRDWLKEALGIAALPSHDTLGRVLARLDPEALATCLSAWSGHLWTPEPGESGEVIAFDGKRLRGALGNLTLVSAWATRARLTLAARPVADGRNEIPAMADLLPLLSLSGCVVTADAMHCQIETAQTILGRKADYVLAIKKNQPELFEAAQHYFGFRHDHPDAPEKGEVPHSFAQTVDKARGQVEVRRCWLVHTTGWIDPFQRWPGLKAVALVERECRRPGGQTRVEARYFLTSLSGSAGKVLSATRRHWQIENGQHWTLDVAYKEDLCRVRAGHLAKNLATLRRLSLNLLKRESSLKVGVQTKRQRAGWDSAYLETLLATGT
jgi:predicted transposase YbfD/YdcC